MPTTEIERAKDLFESLGRISARPMMGGVCLYADGRLFATIHGDRDALYLRTRGALAHELAAAGSHQLTWTRPSDGKVQKMGYWSLPEHALDDPDLACNLARKALAED